MKYFGTDGFRGEANRGLTVDHAFKIGRYVGWYYGARQERKARVVVGQGHAPPPATCSRAPSLPASWPPAPDAYLLHVIPTPGVAYETVDGSFDCGIMISASHNPYTDNGIKLVNGEGYKMDEDVLELIEAYIDGEVDVPLATGDAIRLHRRLHAGPQPLYRPPHLERQLLAPGREGRPGLRQRRPPPRLPSRSSTRSAPMSA